MKEREARSHVVLRVVSIFAVGAVAVALLVGFFFAGDFGEAWRHVTGTERAPARSISLKTTTVQVTGVSRVDGRCGDAGVEQVARSGAEFASKRDAEDRCRAISGAGPETSISLRLDDAGTITMTAGEGKCAAEVQQTWTCLFDDR